MFRKSWSNTWKERLKDGMVDLAQRFRRFESTVSWSHDLQQNTTVTKACERGASSWRTEAEEATGKAGY